MTTEAYHFWFAALLPGIAAFMVNTTMRGGEVLKTSGADLLMIVFSFDLAGIFVFNDLSKYVQHPELKAALQGILVFLMISTLCCWIMLIKRFETHLMLPATTAFNMAKKVGWFFASWAVVVVVSVFHILLFLVR